jgi:hypothetical protein
MEVRVASALDLRDTRVRRIQVTSNAMLLALAHIIEIE